MNQMKEKQDIELIITHFLDGSASDAEVLHLKEWLEVDVNNKKDFFHLKDLWEASQVGNAAGMSAAQIAWKTFSDKTKVKSPKATRHIGRRILVEFIKVAAVFVLAFVVFYGIDKNQVPVDAQLASTKVNVPLGSKSSVLLPDGSEVMLNSGSTLSYPVSFSESKRLVELSGEGFFKVAHDQSKPFVVNAKDMEITVLGTEFNVMAYDDFDRTETTLVAGKVMLKKAGDVSEKVVILKPGQKASLKDNVMKIEKANIELETNWTENKFYFESIPFHELMARLEKWYDVEIEFDHEAFSNLTYTGKFRNEETIWQVLDALQMTTPVRYKAGHRKVFITYKK
ncbi:DUF4974 domain-containing protein [Marinilabiliaceae bacterium JC017]|nr:DUF4974 domain-containing protein [Marinilabiliaceae bacterium JC017]